MPNPIKPPKLGSTLGSTLGKTSNQSMDVSKIGKQGTAVKMPKAEEAFRCICSTLGVFVRAKIKIQSIQVYVIFGVL